MIRMSTNVVLTSQETAASTVHTLHPVSYLEGSLNTIG